MELSKLKMQEKYNLFVTSEENAWESILILCLKIDA